MKFMDKVAAFCLSMTLVGGVSADALYWQVTEDSQLEFDYASLYVTGNDLASPVELEAVDSNGVKPYSATPITSTDLGTYNKAAYSFYVEMYSYSGERIRTGNTYTYTELYSSGYVSTSHIDASAARAAVQNSGFNMGAIPEPTSGLLLLMGGAVLALRRRRRV